MRHSPSASHESLAQAGLAVQSYEIRKGPDPLAGDHPRAHEEGHRAQEAAVQERQEQRYQRFCISKQQRQDQRQDRRQSNCQNF